MQIKMPDYKKSSPGFLSGAMGGRKTRDYLQNRVQQYVKHSNFFINEHHRRVFKGTYPAIYQWVWENQGTNPPRVGQEYKSTKNLTALRQTLDSLGFQEATPGPTPLLLPIRGRGQEEVRILGEQHQASLSQMGLY
jgi:hypothetical protein